MRSNWACHSFWSYSLVEYGTDCTWNSNFGNLVVFVARAIETDLHAIHLQYETSAQYDVLRSTADTVHIMGHIVDLHWTMADAPDD